MLTFVQRYEPQPEYAMLKNNHFNASLWILLKI